MPASDQVHIEITGDSSDLSRAIGEAQRDLAALSAQAELISERTRQRPQAPQAGQPPPSENRKQQLEETRKDIAESAKLIRKFNRAMAKHRIDLEKEATDEIISYQLSQQKIRQRSEAPQAEQTPSPDTDEEQLQQTKKDLTESAKLVRRFNKAMAQDRVNAEKEATDQIISYQLSKQATTPRRETTAQRNQQAETAERLATAEEQINDKVQKSKEEAAQKTDENIARNKKNTEQKTDNEILRDSLARRKKAIELVNELNIQDAKERERLINSTERGLEQQERNRGFKEEQQIREQAVKEDRELRDKQFAEQRQKDKEEREAALAERDKRFEEQRQKDKEEREAAIAERDKRFEERRQQDKAEAEARRQQDKEERASDIAERDKRFKEERAAEQAERDKRFEERRQQEKAERAAEIAERDKQFEERRQKDKAEAEARRQQDKEERAAQQAERDKQFAEQRRIDKEERKAEQEERDKRYEERRQQDKEERAAELAERDRKFEERRIQYKEESAKEREERDKLYEERRQQDKEERKREIAERDKRFEEQRQKDKEERRAEIAERDKRFEEQRQKDKEERRAEIAERDKRFEEQRQKDKEERAAALAERDRQFEERRKQDKEERRAEQAERDRLYEERRQRDKQEYEERRQREKEERKAEQEERDRLYEERRQRDKEERRAEIEERDRRFAEQRQKDKEERAAQIAERDRLYQLQREADKKEREAALAERDRLYEERRQKDKEEREAQIAARDKLYQEQREADKKERAALIAERDALIQARRDTEKKERERANLGSRIVAQSANFLHNIQRASTTLGLILLITGAISLVFATLPTALGLAGAALTTLAGIAATRYVRAQKQMAFETRLTSTEIQAAHLTFSQLGLNVQETARSLETATTTIQKLRLEATHLGQPQPLLWVQDLEGRSRIPIELNNIQNEARSTIEILSSVQEAVFSLTDQEAEQRVLFERIFGEEDKELLQALLGRNLGSLRSAGLRTFRLISPEDEERILGIGTAIDRVFQALYSHLRAFVAENAGSISQIVEVIEERIPHLADYLSKLFGPGLANFAKELPPSIEKVREVIRSLEPTWDRLVLRLRQASNLFTDLGLTGPAIVDLAAALVTLSASTALLTPLFRIASILLKAGAFIKGTAVGAASLSFLGPGGTLVGALAGAGASATAIYYATKAIDDYLKQERTLVEEREKNVKELKQLERELNENAISVIRGDFGAGAEQNKRRERIQELRESIRVLDELIKTEEELIEATLERREGIYGSKTENLQEENEEREKAIALAAEQNRQTQEEIKLIKDRQAIEELSRKLAKELETDPFQNFGIIPDITDPTYSQQIREAEAIEQSLARINKELKKMDEEAFGNLFPIHIQNFYDIIPQIESLFKTLSEASQQFRSTEGGVENFLGQLNSQDVLKLRENLQQLSVRDFVQLEDAVQRASNAQQEWAQSGLEALEELRTSLFDFIFGLQSFSALIEGFVVRIARTIFDSIFDDITRDLRSTLEGAANPSGSQQAFSLLQAIISISGGLSGSGAGATSIEGGGTGELIRQTQGAGKAVAPSGNTLVINRNISATGSLTSEQLSDILTQDRQELIRDLNQDPFTRSYIRDAVEEED